MSDIVGIDAETKGYSVNDRYVDFATLWSLGQIISQSTLVLRRINFMNGALVLCSKGSGSRE